VATLSEYAIGPNERMPRFTIVAFRKSYPIISMHFMGALKRYWGYGLLFVTIAAVVNNWFGPPALMLMSGAVSLYFLFQVPNWLPSTAA
jgi:hypothetical protein